MHCSQNSNTVARTKSAEKIVLGEHSGTWDQEISTSLIRSLFLKLLKSTSQNKLHLLPFPFMIYKAYFNTHTKKKNNGVRGYHKL